MLSTKAFVGNQGNGQLQPCYSCRFDQCCVKGVAGLSAGTLENSADPDQMLHIAAF